MDGVRHLPDLPPVLTNGPEVLAVDGDRAASDLDPDQLSRHTLAPDPFQRVLADVVGFLFLHEALEAGHLERVVLQRHVAAVVEDPRFHPASIAGAGGMDVEGFAGLHDPLPQLDAAAGVVSEVDLEALLAAPAGA